MIKFTANGPNGKTILGLGLQIENIKLLMDGKPIIIDGSKMEIGNIEIAIFYGTTQQEMINMLREGGIKLPPEEEWKR
jgi:hypothetical protein